MTDHRELWLTAQPLSIYRSLPVHSRAVLLAHSSLWYLSMTFLMTSSSKPAPPSMLMIPSCTVLFHSEGLWYSVQQDLTSLNIWSHETKMKFNASKCKVLTATWKKTPVTHDYLLADVNLQRVQEEIDLGVTISRMLRAWRPRLIECWVS